MLVGRKRYCDKCGCEIEHDLFHTLEWFDSYEHTHETKHMAAEVCNGCYEKGFHHLLQAGTDVRSYIELSDEERQTIIRGLAKTVETEENEGLYRKDSWNQGPNLDMWDAVKKEA